MSGARGSPPALPLAGLPAALLVGAAVALCYQFVDRAAAVWARGLDPQVRAAARLVTALGYSGPWLIGLAGAWLLLRRRGRARAARRALFCLAAVLASGLAVNLLKWVAGRWRPDPFFDEPSRYGFAFFEVGYAHSSFPSGHATTVGALACALSLQYPRWRVLWFAAAALVAASRVLVGAHYPGDVVAGLWLGSVAALWLARSRWFRGSPATPGV